MTRIGRKYLHWYRHTLRYRMELAVDYIRGTDYARWVEPEELHLDAERSNRYTPSGYRFLKTSIDRLDISAADRILDVGCGKGSAMRTLLKFPFEKVDGLEISADLAEIARTNLRKYQSRTTIFVGDAALETELLGEYNYMYLYNPFPKEVFEDFLRRLISSRSGSEIRIVYCNPVFTDILLAAGFDRSSLSPNRGHGQIDLFSRVATPK